jgi:hypothetical protein
LALYALLLLLLALLALLLLLRAAMALRCSSANSLRWSASACAATGGRGENQQQQQQEESVRPAVQCANVYQTTAPLSCDVAASNPILSAPCHSGPEIQIQIQIQIQTTATLKTRSYLEFLPCLPIVGLQGQHLPEVTCRPLQLILVDAGSAAPQQRLDLV